MESFDIPLAALDLAAVFVFGAAGALAAARRQHDIVTFGFFAAITGVGGGTLRDLLIGAPVFWVLQPSYLVACLAAATAVWLFGAGRFRVRALTWLDALGMAAYSVVGAAKATEFGAPPLPAIVMGALTATCGGVIRDVLAGEPSVLLRRDVYVTAALLGATVYVAAAWGGIPAAAAGWAGFAAALTVRAGAILFRWTLPGFLGRTPPEE